MEPGGARIRAAALVPRLAVGNTVGVGGQLCMPTAECEGQRRLRGTLRSTS